MIDARVVSGQDGHGIARYTKDLILSYNQINDSNLKFIVLVNSHSLLLSCSFSSQFQFQKMRSSWISLWGQLELLWMIVKHRPCLFHTPSFIVPFLSFVPLVATIHDVNHLALSNHYSKKQKIYYWLLAKKLQHAKKIITISLFSKQEIIAYLKIPEEKICVIYNGLSNEFRQFQANPASPERMLEVRKKYSLPENFIFAAGNPKPHKNLDRLTQAHQKGSFAFPLVILSKGKSNENVTFLEGVPSADLPIVYALSRVFVFPSLYEGFGFPPLEALACGVPVACSNASCLPEILKDCVLYFDPKDISGMQNAMHAALNLNESQKQIQNEKGLKLTKFYSIEKMSQNTFDVYKELLCLVKN